MSRHAACVLTVLVACGASVPAAADPGPKSNPGAASAEAPLAASAPPAVAAPRSAGPAPATPAATPAAPSVARTPARSRPSAPSLLARIDLSGQRIQVTEHGKVVHSWPISSGRVGYETPRGTFRGAWMARMWYSRTYDDAPMPHAVFFNGGIAVHATSATRLLGQPASHGCVRISPANAKTFYALVQKHGLRRTQFQVTGSTPRPALVAKRPAHRGRPSMRELVTAPHPRHERRRTAVREMMRDERGRLVLPPGSPYRGRESFVHNGVLYVRVR